MGQSLTSELGTEQINDQSYEFIFEFKTELDQPGLALRKGSIKRAEIFDEIHKWYHYGSAEIRNPHNVLNTADKLQGRDGREINNCFKFRNDERMFLHVRISPVLKNDMLPDHLDTETFTMEFLFNITEIQDLCETGTGKTEDDRILKIWFEDARHYKLRTQLSNYSTTRLYESGEEETTGDAKAYTGLVIKDILTTALEPIGGANFAENFDEGSTQIFYTSPGDATYNYDLNKIISSHLSSEASGECRCLLKASRFYDNPEKNKFHLIPINDLYANSYDSQTKTSGPYMTEIFKLTNSGSKGGEKGPPKSIEIVRGTDPGIYEFPDHSLIYYPYKFEPVQNIVNATTLISRETHVYNRKNKEFHIRFTSQQNINTEYKDKVAGPSAGSNESIVNSNPARNTNQNRLVNFALTDDKTKADKYAINDSQILGQYLILRVAHIFNEGQYTNTIEAVTPNNFKPLNQTTA